MNNTLNIALPKGRLGEGVYDIFESLGYGCEGIKDKTNRKLIFENEELQIKYFWVKPTDVSVYVEHGAADIGVVGRDILLEYEPDICWVYYGFGTNDDGEHYHGWWLVREKPKRGCPVWAFRAKEAEC